MHAKPLGGRWGTDAYPLGSNTPQPHMEVSEMYLTAIAYASLMFNDGFEDGKAHLPSKYSDEIYYSMGYAEGENDV